MSHCSTKTPLYLAGGDSHTMPLDLGGKSTIELDRLSHFEVAALRFRNSYSCGNFFGGEIMGFSKKANLLSMLLIAICLLTAHPALSQTPYYAGKTITIIRGGGPGGSGEFQSRALMP